jgi:hypothetical protein
MSLNRQPVACELCDFPGLTFNRAENDQNFHGVFLPGACASHVAMETV